MMAVNGSTTVAAATVAAVTIVVGGGDRLDESFVSGGGEVDDEINFGPILTTTPVSPVTLQQVSDWSRVARLLLVVGLAVVGSVGNVYMISAVMIEDHLKKRGELLSYFV